jgi:hypothetical protein
MDDVTVNLKLLARVQKHQKIVTRDTFLNVESKSLIPECVRRWRRGDDRHSAIQKINETVSAGLELVTTRPSIRTELLEACAGIENLKETYSTCSQTCARLDTIIDKIKLLERPSCFLRMVSYSEEKNNRLSHGLKTNCELTTE